MKIPPAAPPARRVAPAHNGDAVTRPPRESASAEDPRAWMPRLAGAFIAFEGPDGSGKSTQFSRFAALARDAALEVCEVREPGGTEISEKIRDVLLRHYESEMTLRCEMLLYMASRAQLVEEQIRPALARNALVLADRFVASTVAYQGHAGGLPLEDIEAVAKVACGRVRPDLVAVFDVDEQTAAARMNGDKDRMEAKGAAFHRRVRDGYHAQARAEPHRFLMIDAARDADAVHQSLLQGVHAWLARRDD